MKKTNKLDLLKGMFYVSLVIANVLAGKVVDFGWEIFGVNILFPAAVVAYAVTFLMTDIIGEEYGKEEAKKTVIYGFVVQVAASIFILLGQLLPAQDPSVQEAYKILLGQNWVFVVGSLVAYYISQSWDVFVFQKIRKHRMSKVGNNKQRWIWNNVSTMTSQAIDTFVFIGIAFGLGLGWWFNPETRVLLFGLMLGQYLVKFVISALDTPFFYLLTSRQENK